MAERLIDKGYAIPRIGRLQVHSSVQAGHCCARKMALWFKSSFEGYLMKPNYLIIIPCDAMHELTNCHMTLACKADLQNLEETIANSDGSQCLSLDTP